MRLSSRARVVRLHLEPAGDADAALQTLSTGKMADMMKLKKAEEDLQKARGKSGAAAAAAAVASAGTPGIVTETKDDPKGLNLVHVVVAALVAFIFGRIIS